MQHSKVGIDFHIWIQTLFRQNGPEYGNYIIYESPLRKILSWILSCLFFVLVSNIFYELWSYLKISSVCTCSNLLFINSFVYYYGCCVYFQINIVDDYFLVPRIHSHILLNIRLYMHHIIRTFCLLEWFMFVNELAHTYHFRSTKILIN